MPRITRATDSRRGVAHPDHRGAAELLFRGQSAGSGWVASPWWCSPWRTDRRKPFASAPDRTGLNPVGDAATGMPRLAFRPPTAIEDHRAYRALLRFRLSRRKSPSPQPPRHRHRSPATNRAVSIALVTLRKVVEPIPAKLLLAAPAETSICPGGGYPARAIPGQLLATCADAGDRRRTAPLRARSTFCLLTRQGKLPAAQPVSESQNPPTKCLPFGSSAAVGRSEPES